MYYVCIARRKSIVATKDWIFFIVFEHTNRTSKSLNLSIEVVMLTQQYNCDSKFWELPTHNKMPWTKCDKNEWKKLRRKTLVLEIIFKGRRRKVFVVKRVVHLPTIESLFLEKFSWNLSVNLTSVVYWICEEFGALQHSVWCVEIPFGNLLVSFISLSNLARSLFKYKHEYVICRYYKVSMRLMSHTCI